MEGLDGPKLRVLAMFEGLGKPELDLHELFVAGGNDVEARSDVDRRSTRIDDWQARRLRSLDHVRPLAMNAGTGTRTSGGCNPSRRMSGFFFAPGCLRDRR